MALTETPVLRVYLALTENLLGHRKSFLSFLPSIFYTKSSHIFVLEGSKGREMGVIKKRKREIVKNNS